jgi:hypothetical protein
LIESVLWYQLIEISYYFVFRDELDREGMYITKIKVKCEKCDREFSEQPDEYPGKVYVHHEKVLCEDCLVDMGVEPGTADPSKTFIYTHSDLFRVI